jgi:hypothetical protein
LKFLRRRHRLRHPLWFALTARTPSKLRPYVTAEFDSGNHRDRLVAALADSEPTVAAAVLQAADGFARMTGAAYTIDRPVVAEATTGLLYQGATLLNPPVVSDLRLGERIARRSLYSLARHPPADRRRDPTPVFLVRHVWEANHYHLINDVIAQFRLLARDHDLARGEVWVAPQTLANPLFTLFRETGRALRGVTVLPQARNVRLAGLTMVKVPHADVANFDFLLDQLGDPPAPLTPGRRLFVNRRPGSGRCMTNAGDVEAGLHHRGFETVWPDGMTIAEQMETFAAADAVVGIHGAGLTNIIFRRGQRMSLVEIFPPALIAPHYASICAEYGFAYRGVVGTATGGPPSRAGWLQHDPTYANFTVDVAAVLRAVDAVGERP